MLAVALLFHGDPDRAEKLLAESRAICRHAGEWWWLGIVLNVSVVSALRPGDRRRAARSGRDALLAGRKLRDSIATGGTVEVLGWVAAAAGEHDRAARLLGAADRQWEAMGGSPFAGDRLPARRSAETATRKALGARFATEYAAGARLCLDDAVHYALGTQPEAAVPAPPDGPVRLNRRETENDELITQGLCDREYAARPALSPRTAEC